MGRRRSREAGATADPASGAARDQRAGRIRRGIVSARGDGHRFFETEAPSVLGWEGLRLMPSHLGFSRFVVVIRTIQAHASSGPGFIDVSAQHVPALAQVQHAVMKLSRPTLGRDAHPFFLGNITRSLSSLMTTQVARLHKNQRWARSRDSARVSRGPEGHVQRNRTWSQDWFRNRRVDPLGSFVFKRNEPRPASSGEKPFNR
jgi:hypothetical protein